MTRTTRLSSSSFVALIACALVALLVAAPTASAKEKKKSDGHSWSGTVVSYSPSEISLLVNGDKTKCKTLLINDKTTITGTVKHNGNVTVTYDGKTALTITGDTSSDSN